MGVPIPLACFLYFLVRYRSPGYALCGACVLAAYYAAAMLPKGILRRPEAAESWGRALLALTAVSLTGFGAWQYLQARDIGDLDHASYATALWNLGHGNWHYTFEGRNLLGIHSQYTALLWIPVQAAAGGLGLKLGEAACILAAVGLVFRRYRETLPSPAWAALAVLLAPCLASQFFFGFHPEFLGAPLLVLALIAYRDGKLGLFLVWTFLLAFTKETFTLAVGGILLIALRERRGWRWILLPGLLCCAQMAIYWIVILPRFAPAGNQLGNFLPPALSQVPGLWWRSSNAFYLLHVFLPFLPLILGYPLRYVLLPLPLMAFYAAMPQTLFTVMWPNYAFPLAFLCAAGPILAGRDPRGPENPGRPVLEARILAACAVTSLLCYPLWREILSVPHGHGGEAREASRLNASIPATLPILVNSAATTRFAARREVAVWGQLSEQGPRPFYLDHYAYVILDTAFAPYWLVDKQDLAGGIQALAESTAWEKLPAREGYLVFRRIETRQAGL